MLQPCPLCLAASLSISHGKTEDEAKKNIKEAIKLHLSALAEEGIPIKPPKEAKETTVAVMI